MLGIGTLCPRFDGTAEVALSSRLPALPAPGNAQVIWAGTLLGVLLVVWLCGYSCGSCVTAFRNSAFRGAAAGQAGPPSPAAEAQSLKRRRQARSGQRVSPLREGFAVKHGALSE